jgi:hypothetical protein
MTQRVARCCIVFTAVWFCSAVSAQTFNYSVSCAQTTLGPVNVEFQGGSGSGSVSLTPSVLSTGLNILSIPVNDQSNSFTVTSGNFNGTLPCVLTFGGVSVNYARPISLAISPNPGPNATNCTPVGFAGSCLTLGAVSVTVNLGAQGTVVITAPSNVVDGYDTSEAAVGFITLVPGSAIDTALLTPAAPPSATPLPPSSFLVLTGLAGVGLYQARRKLSYPR